ncbi:MAG: YgiQ family radical SAM protein, partial [Bacilli bacterium]|nr:YgiQ family radical SAM protein [Bacilli bacterium]
MPFLPITKKEMIASGITKPDFVFVTGDAYIDHPSFGCAIITRVLENFGYKCCIISQPNINNLEEFKEFGEPRLGFLVSSGNIDSMVNHYTVARRRRTKDYYTPNGEMGKRPDRATTLYSKIIRELYPNTPIILGGIEASLRRLSHYDYWDNKVLKSILIDSKADMVVYGMGEKPIVEIADALASGLNIKDIIYIRNTVYKTNNLDMVAFKAITLPTYKNSSLNKEEYLKSFTLQYNNTDAFNGKALIEEYEQTFVVQNPPEFALTTEEMDAIYALPYMRETHPLIEKKGHVPAIDEVKFSIIANRGCFGGCHFCALTMHQGRIIQSRSKDSVVNEALLITSMEDFKGYIHDVGGPTANFYNKACSKQEEFGACVNK